MEELLKIAINVAKEAGGILLKEYLNREILINSESGRDIKLQSDINSEKYISTMLYNKTKFSILSEEFGIKKGSSSDNYLWIIDPLDGSLNFSRGIDVFCISIGLWQDDSPVLGVIYDFLHQNIFYGIVGKGAFKNDVPIKVSTITSKDKSMLLTGFPVYRSFDSESLLKFIQNVTNYKKVRLLGSAAISLTYIATGSAEAYTEERIAFWDVAAGIALVLAAGGKCNYSFHKDNPNLLDVFAHNGKIVDEK